MNAPFKVPYLCPICGSDRYGPYKGTLTRRRCVGCGAHERQRYMALAVKQILPEPTGAPVIHAAPEKMLAKVLIERYGAAYTAADLSPERYPFSPGKVLTMDLARPRDFLEPESVQGFVHLHVLEHVMADFVTVMRDIHSRIQPGGFHAFCIPFFSKWYREDMDPNMSREERTRLFGQNDHVRSFGLNDFPSRFETAFEGMTRINLADHLTGEDIERIAVDPRTMTMPNGHAPYIYIKTGT